TPAGDVRFNEEHLPTWIDGGKTPFFGVPGNHWRGFKIAGDTHGPLIDPTSMDRKISQEKLAAARAYLAMRFPAMADSPVLECRGGHYKTPIDHTFILGPPPEAKIVWFVGGGSGHGFNPAPVIGEMITATVLGRAAPPSEMALDRLLKLNAH